MIRVTKKEALEDFNYLRNLVFCVYDDMWWDSVYGRISAGEDITIKEILIEMVIDLLKGGNEICCDDEIARIKNDEMGLKLMKKYKQL